MFLIRPKVIPSIQVNEPPPTTSDSSIVPSRVDRPDYACQVRVKWLDGFYLDLELTWPAKTYVQASQPPPGVGLGVFGASLEGLLRAV